MAEAVVLDTHAWIWWADQPSKLSDAAAQAIETAETLLISAISCWEVAMLEVKGRISFDRPASTWVRQALALPGVRAVPLDPPTAVAAAGLHSAGFPPDPADRIVYATARSLGAPLITRDVGIRAFDPRGTLW